MVAINIDKNNFQREVINSSKPVLLDFSTLVVMKDGNIFNQAMGSRPNNTILAML